MVEKRITSFSEQWEKWLEKNPGNVAISCHGNSIRPIIRIFEHLSVEQMIQLHVPQDNAAVYELNYDLSIEHLEERAAKPHWVGIIISPRVKLAIDPLNLLNVYY